MGGRAIPPLRGFIVGREKPWAKLEAFKALLQLGDDDALLYAGQSIHATSPRELLTPVVPPGAVVEFQRLYLHELLRGKDLSARLDLLFEMLLDDRKGTLAVAGLVETGTPAVPRLIRFLGDKLNPPSGRHGARAALWLIGDQRAVAVMVRIVADDTEPAGLRTAVAISLGWMNDPSAIPALQSVAEHDPEHDSYTTPELKLQAKNALERLRAGQHP